MLFYARHDDDDDDGNDDDGNDDDEALTCTHAHDVHQRVDGHGSSPDISPNYTCMHACIIDTRRVSRMDRWMDDMID